MIRNFNKSVLAVALVFSIFISFSTKSQNGPVAEQLGSGFKFTEGPLWIDKVGLIFSDVQADSVYLYDTLSGEFSVYLPNSGKSNGLALDASGKLVLAQHETRGISRWENGQLLPLATTFRGKKLNSPNDLVVQSNGSIYFTDPTYGISAEQQVQEYRGVYRYNTKGQLYLLDSTFTNPNGLAFSPDEKLLYINESQNRTIYVLDVINDTVLTNKRIFFQFPQEGTGNADGMKVDPSGNIYSTGPLGIWVISPQKVVLDTILVPAVTTNVAFGNSDRKTLYITAGQRIFRAVNAVVTGINDGQSSNTSPISTPYADVQSNTTYIPLHLERGGNIKMDVRSLNGTTITTLANKVMGAGDHTITWSHDNVSDGVYLIQLTMDQQSFIQKTVVIKK